MDCFITSNLASERFYSRQLTFLALSLSGFNPTFIQKPMLERYYECEKQAKSPIYLLCDDDIIPGTKDTLKELVATLERYPSYSQLGLGWRPDMTAEVNNSWIRHQGEEVWEMDHVGGCLAIRRGTIKDLGYETDYPNGIGDDKVVGRGARELGYKVGIVPKLYFHHLGLGQSQVWKSR